MAPVSSSQVVIENYSKNLWGRSIKTLYNVTKSDAEGFFKIIRDQELDIRIGTSLFPFEALQDILIQVKHGELEQPNAVIKIAE